MGYTKKSEQSKRSEGSGVKATSRGSSLYSFVRLVASHKVSSKEQASAYMKSVVMCLFCGKLPRYISIILSVGKIIIAPKACVAVTVFR